MATFSDITENYPDKMPDCDRGEFLRLLNLHALDGAGGGVHVHTYQNQLAAGVGAEGPVVAPVPDLLQGFGCAVAVLQLYDVGVALALEENVYAARCSLVFRTDVVAHQLADDEYNVLVMGLAVLYQVVGSVREEGP